MLEKKSWIYLSSESETCERKRREKEKLNGTHVFANVSLNILHKIHVFDILDWFHFLWHFTTATTKEKQQIECLQWLLVHLIRKLHSTIKPNQKSPQFIVHWHSISCIISSKIYTALKRTKKIWQNACLHAYFPTENVNELWNIDIHT